MHGHTGSRQRLLGLQCGSELGNQDWTQGTSCEFLSAAEVRDNVRLTHCPVSKDRQVGWQKGRDCFAQLGSLGVPEKPAHGEDLGTEGGDNESILGHAIFEGVICQWELSFHQIL